MDRIRLSFEKIGKVYPGVVALQGVDLSVEGGEVVGIVGENGAGKSTLMKILGGVVAPDSGHMVIDGVRFDRLDPAGAAAQGIAFVHQELTALDNLDVAGNVLLGRELRGGPFGLLDRRAMARKVDPILKLLGARFGPSDPVAALSLADRQLVEIARALATEARLIILDEPTSSLTLSETNRLLEVIGDLRGRGVAIIFISHRLSEIEAVCDRVTVLRDGHNVGALPRGEIDRDSLVRMMIGRDLRRFRDAAHAGNALADPALTLEGLRTAAHPDAAVDLVLRKGEVLGLAGLVGAGRTELARVLFGIDPPEAGHVSIAGRPIPPGSVIEAIEAGICLVPEDRKAHGLFLDFGVADNITLPSLARLSARGVFANAAAEQALASDARAELGIKTATLNAAVAELSGGNQQKVVLAKWLAIDPKVMIFDEPTRGIDVGAKAEVYRLMHALAERGVGILMISSDMEEIVGVSDRVAVMAGGRITGVLDPAEISEEAILRLAVR
ncbi:MAG: sugar ABC transporter ATP-binding protein [Maritimibacter sp.]|nr:sugar ABC transporter ATP-binding protein [Maritimibacter sp.]